MGSLTAFGKMSTVRESEMGTPTVMPLVAILDEEGQMTGITCPLNLGVDPHDIEGCEDLLESYFMQVSDCRLTSGLWFTHCSLCCLTVFNSSRMEHGKSLKP